MTFDHRTPDDRIRAVFEEPVVPLNPPPGTWERIEHAAARHRRHRRLVAAGSAAAVVAVLGAGAAWFAGAAGDDRLIPAPPGPSASVPATDPRPTDLPTRRPTATPSTPADVTLPRGGPVPAGFVAVSASTTPGGYLYALGTAPCPSAPCTSLARSHDGGATWVGVPAPAAELAPGATRPGSPDDVAGQGAGTVRQVRFATPRDGWAFGGALWETHDGGATWAKARGLRGRVLDLVVDGDRVVVASTSCAGDGCPSRLELAYAGVRGGEFTADVGFVRPGVTRARFSDGSGTILLTVGTATETVVYAVRDGDPTEITSPCPPEGGDYIGGLLAAVPPASGRRGLVAWCGEPGAGNLQVTTRRSADGGGTWTTTGAGLRITNGVFAGTAVTLDGLVVASGSPDLGGSLHVSRTGGREWSGVRGPAPGPGWRWVAAAGADRVLALPLQATGAVYVSTDGGRSFAARPIR